ncbi:hypothetical protein SKAU_G00404370 [Synaphobranchus kaupii]|uniref:Uncharacterized protein n=1 Tax=Synaphobranchus kaupii TaxID=118154 RepID=A0A9Q1IAP2_SYNKA|nr:hypothetical protein SKAU_G00404370 [Synaphobranchus kaupii]
MPLSPGDRRSRRRPISGSRHSRRLPQEGELAVIRRRCSVPIETSPPPLRSHLMRRRDGGESGRLGRRMEGPGGEERKVSLSTLRAGGDLVAQIQSWMCINDRLCLKEMRSRQSTAMERRINHCNLTAPVEPAERAPGGPDPQRHDVGL